jgi:hypothetical protein
MKIKDIVKEDIYTVYRQYAYNADTWEDHHDHTRTENIAYATGNLKNIEFYFKAKYPDWDVRVEKLSIPYEAEIIEVTSELGKEAKIIEKKRTNLEKKIKDMPKV